ncbi:MAG: nitrate- and nitrite sensing domain-containing protein [Sulfurimonas sp.]|nr:nitrate- and nitrite sensing domain-containing protein [Sulfurimonas sp.]
MKIIELKRKIPKFLIIPLLILFSFSTYSGVNKLRENAIYETVHQYMHFATVASSLIHELQKERGYSNGFIASNGKSFLVELKQQREQSNKKIEVLKKYLTNFDFDVYEFSIKELLKELFESLNKIDEYRVMMDTNRLPSSKSMDYYTKNINILLELIEKVIGISDDSELVDFIQSYIIMMKVKEKAGIERAIINRVYSQGKLSNKEFYKFGELVSAQEVYIKNFKNIALQRHIDLFEYKIDTHSFKEIVKERNIIYAKNLKNEILSSIKEHVGYGGLIHDFKNYVIRGEEKYAIAVKKQYDKLLSEIKKYKIIEGVTKEEIDKLNTIQNVFLEYVQGLPKIVKSYTNGGTVTDIDKIVKVDDMPAIEALRELTTHIYGSEVNWFKNATYRINALKSMENKIASDLHTLIDNRSRNLSILIAVEAVVMFVILIIIYILVEMFRELKESEKRLKRAQANTKSGSYEYYVQDNLLLCSDEQYKLLQVDKKSFIPKIESYMKYIHPDDIDIVKDGMDLAITSKILSSFEYRMILPDKTVPYIKSTVEVIKYNKKGNPLIMVGTATDITESKNLKQEIIDTQKDVIFTMGAIGESRSRETGKHVKRVAEYSKLLYLLSGANKNDAELLKMASPMHDIGKVGIPDNILNKPGKLTPGEWAIMQTHSEMGYEMLKNSDREILKLASTVALTHHEKYDGSGYPRGLVANEIPIVGRITALADVFDALGSDRCYKTAWELDKILELIKEERAKHFDPQLVDLFLENLDKFLEIRDRYKDKF